MADPLVTATSGNVINKTLIDPAIEWKKNAKAMRNNTESLNVVRNRLKAAIADVRRKVVAADAIMAQGGALLVPQTVVDWRVRVKTLEKKVDDILGEAHRLYPPGDAAASAPANAWTKLAVKLKYANKVVKYDDVVTKYLDKSEASTKATMDLLLQAPEHMSSVEKEMEELERVKDDIESILNKVKYRVEWPQLFISDKRAWQGDIEVMRAKVEKTKEDYSNMVGSLEITSDWLVAFNEKTGQLVHTRVAASKSRGVELKAKAEEHVACLDDVVTKRAELWNDMAGVLARQKTIRDKVEMAKSNLRVPREDVKGWLNRVDLAKGDSDQADAEFQELANSNGNRISLDRWRELGDQIADIRQRQVDKLVAESEGFEHQDGVDHARLHPPMPEPLENVIGQEKYVEMVRKEIEAEDVGVIGIYGEGGVGKSTLLSTIYSDPTITREFKVVIKIDTQNLSSDSILTEEKRDVLVSSHSKLTEKIQEAIMEKLPFLSQTQHGKREKIWNALQDWKFLILIDNIWATLDLRSEIGVPLKSVAGDAGVLAPHSNNSKVIFTTRFENVADDMQARKIKVTCLDDKEAWDVFKHSVGEDTLKLHDEIPNLAKQIAEKCQGLPLALKLIGTAMRNEAGSRIDGWKYGLRTLSGTDGQDIFEGVGTLYSRLALSYHLLPSATLKQCFLYCSLFPDSYLIPIKGALITSWMGEKFFDDCRSVEHARERGSYIIEALKRACLLEVEIIDYNMEFVRMHDVVRGMARWIVSKDEEGRGKFVCDTSGLGFVRSDAEDWPEDVQRVYVGGHIPHGFRKLKLGPKPCNKLSTLIFHYSNLEHFEDGCFALMPNLRVLKFMRSRIVNLPIGTGELEQLRCLILSYTDRLRQLPEVGLDKVKLLLVHNPVWKGNSQIGGFIKRLLSQLWVLDIRTPTLEDIQLQTADLVDAPHLQELSIAIKTQSNLEALARSSRLAKCVVALSVRVDFKKTGGVFNLLREVGTLNKLQVLTISGCSSLKRIVVPSADHDNFLHSLERLYIRSNAKLELLQVGHPLQNLRSLLVDQCNLITVLAIGSLAHTLEHLHLSSCSALTQILHIALEGEGSLVFQKLKVIQLHDLRNLTAICNDPDRISFPSLENFHVDSCRNLNRLPPAIPPSILTGKHSIAVGRM